MILQMMLLTKFGTTNITFVWPIFLMNEADLSTHAFLESKTLFTNVARKWLHPYMNCISMFIEITSLFKASITNLTFEFPFHNMYCINV